MIYLSGGGSADEIQTLLKAQGLDTEITCDDMDAMEIYQGILEADAVVMHYIPDAQVGTELGLALAFGKPIYMLGVLIKEDFCADTLLNEPNVFVGDDMEGIQHFTDIEGLVEAVVEAFA